MEDPRVAFRVQGRIRVWSPPRPSALGIRVRVRGPRAGRGSESAIKSGSVRVKIRILSRGAESASRCCVWGPSQGLESAAGVRLGV